MAIIYHCSIKIISHNKGKSAVTAVFSDRAVLWDDVEKIEKAKNAQLAREIEIALPRELTREQGISLVREYVKEQFVNAGMRADFAIHDIGGNPHAHIMLTMCPIQQTKTEEWRAAWAQLCNRELEQYGHAECIDHHSYERQGIDQIPTVHLGVAASAMEKRGIRTERSDLNREIEVINQKFRQLKARIAKLQKWLKEEQEITEPPTLADYIQDILSHRAWEGKTQVSQSIYNLKDAAKMLILTKSLRNCFWGSMEPGHIGNGEEV